MTYGRAALVGALLAGMLVPAALAADNIRVADGDTFTAKIRISNIDTPDINGKCAYERELAQRAKVFTTEQLAKGSVVIRQDKRGIDRYGRMLARVEVRGQDLGEMLVKEGLARLWRGKREPWCE